jgi:cysteine synthase
MNCRGVAVLPEEMSQERFRWLERWVRSPADVIRTPGCERNVKEIYDRCHELERDPANVILNQFSEFANHLAHLVCTGEAMSAIVEHLRHRRRHVAAFVSATGSAGTIAAGDLLKERYGARIVAAEPLECATLLENGFGPHNIQGIGDQHVPLIHNVMNTDAVTAVSDRATDQLGVMFGEPAGREWLATERKVPAEVIAALDSFGLSSICNVVAAVKTAKLLGLGHDDLLLTVATDGAELYASERARVLERDFAGRFERRDAAEVFARWMLGAGADHACLLGEHDRRRIFNLGYFTWVEQQGVPVEDFVVRRNPGYWRALRELIPRWNAQILEFNERTGMRERT